MGGVKGYEHNFAREKTLLLVFPTLKKGRPAVDKQKKLINKTT